MAPTGALRQAHDSGIMLLYLVISAAAARGNSLCLLRADLVSTALGARGTSRNSTARQARNHMKLDMIILAAASSREQNREHVTTVGLGRQHTGVGMP